MPKGELGECRGNDAYWESTLRVKRKNLQKSSSQQRLKNECDIKNITIVESSVRTW